MDVEKKVHQNVFEIQRQKQKTNSTTQVKRQKPINIYEKYQIIKKSKLIKVAQIQLKKEVFKEQAWNEIEKARNKYFKYKQMLEQ